MGEGGGARGGHPSTLRTGTGTGADAETGARVMRGARTSAGSYTSEWNVVSLMRATGMVRGEWRGARDSGTRAVTR